MKVLSILFFTAFILFLLPVTAQELTPPIENYSSAFYKAGRQNWGIAIDDKGLVYVANHKGLLVFDGQRWELLPLKNLLKHRPCMAHQTHYAGIILAGWP